MAYATFDSIEIPKVHHVDVERIEIGDRSRTASGTLRVDTVAVKQRWILHCRPVPKYKISPLLDHLESILYAEGAFWLYGMSEPITARINPDGIAEKIVACTDDDGTWHKDGRQITLTVEEV